MSSNIKRKTTDLFLQGLTYLASSISLITLLSIIVFVFGKGYKLINFQLIINDYESKGYVAELQHGSQFCNCDAQMDFEDGTYYSRRWGIAFSDSIDLLGKNVVEVEYVSPFSPFRALQDKGIGTEPILMRTDYTIIRIAFDDKPSALSRDGAQIMANELDNSDSFREIEFKTTGGGIRGSIITTLYLIVLTLIMAIPIGVGAAVFLNEYAPINRFTRVIRSLIETLTGVPSIIYGLMGLAVFVPLTVQLTSATGGNIISGAMTMSVILLPIIIRTTEESLKVVPDEYRQASLALGASRTQTTFKVVLPNAIPGILTATLLAIGRIIGESAALVFAIGASIKDNISLTGKSTSLAVHIWTMMTDEPANIELSSTIAIIIIFIVLLLNIMIKLLSARFMKRKLGM